MLEPTPVPDQPATPNPAGGAAAPAVPPNPAAAAAPPAPAAAAAPDGKPPETPKAQAKPADPAEPEIKLPDGMQVDQEILGSFKELAKKGPLTPQGVIDFFLGLGKKATEVRDQNRQAGIDAIKADPEFGGAKYDQTKADAISFVSEFGGEEASKEFVALGADTNPGIVKMLARARKAIAEDKLVKGKTTTLVDDADAQGRKLFPKSWDAMKKIAPPA